MTKRSISKTVKLDALPIEREFYLNLNYFRLVQTLNRDMGENTSVACATIGICQSRTLEIQRDKVRGELVICWDSTSRYIFHKR